MDLMYNCELDEERDNDDGDNDDDTNAPDIEDAENLDESVAPVSKKLKIEHSTLAANLKKASEDVIVVRTRGEYRRFVLQIYGITSSFRTYYLLLGTGGSLLPF